MRRALIRQCPNVPSVPFPEEKGFQENLRLVVGKVLGQNIRGILGTRDMFKTHDTSSHSFTALMLRECIPALRQRRMWDCRAVHNRTFIAK